MPRASPPASPSARGWRGCRRSACARRCCACWWHRAGRSWSAPCRTTACSRYVLAAAPRPALLDPPRRHRGRARARRAMPSCGSPRWRSRCRRTRTGCASACASPTRSMRGSCARRAARPTSARPRPRRGQGLSLRRRRGGLSRARADGLGALGRSAPDDPAWRDRYALPERWQPPRFPLGGADVMALGVAAGPARRRAAARAGGVVDRRRLRRGRAALRAKLQRMVAQA